jgi:hypothetical protein
LLSLRQNVKEQVTARHHSLKWLQQKPTPHVMQKSTAGVLVKLSMPTGRLLFRSALTIRTPMEREFEEVLCVGGGLSAIRYQRTRSENKSDPSRSFLLRRTPDDEEWGVAYLVASGQAVRRALGFFLAITRSLRAA